LLYDDAVIARLTQLISIALKRLDDSMRLVHQGNMTGASGQCFKTQDTAASKQFKDTFSGDAPLQPVEQGFSNTIRSWSEIFFWRKGNFATAPISTDNPDSRSCKRLRHSNQPQTS
jgi:hypothetical protein